MLPGIGKDELRMPSADSTGVINVRKEDFVNLPDSTEMPKYGFKLDHFNTNK